MTETDALMLKLVCSVDQTGVMEELVRLVHKYGMPLENIRPFLEEFAEMMETKLKHE